MFISGYGCLHLPSQSRHKVFIGLTARAVRQDGALVLLALSNVEHSNLVCLSTTEKKHIVANIKRTTTTQRPIFYKHNRT